MDLSCQILVVGSGAAGTAVALDLVDRGYSVALAFHDPNSGASFSNQKWLHSGLWPPGLEPARELWASYNNIRPIMSKYILSKGGVFLFNESKSLCDHKLKRSKELKIMPCDQLTPAHDKIWDEYVLGKPKYTAGFTTPDAVIDFPAMLKEMRGSIKQKIGDKYLEGAKVTGLCIDEESSTLTGAILHHGDNGQRISCDFCVLAAGAGIVDLVNGNPQIHLKNHKLKRLQCNVLTYDGEIVPRIVGWMDGPKLTLVPFQGTTIVCDNETTEVNPDREFNRSDMEVRLRKHFPYANWGNFRHLNSHFCIKTEVVPIKEGQVEEGSLRNYNFTVLDTGDHGVSKLAIAIPGKASLLFSLAHEVTKLIEGYDNHPGKSGSE